jgi:tetratricopeptide (TPR) repeat protein
MEDSPVADTTNKTEEEAAVFAEGSTCSTADIVKSVQGFLIGDITLAQLEGFSAEDMYGIADMGYAYLEEGKLTEAERIFAGLNVYNPFDPYFHAVLGSIYQRQGKLEDALRHYESAVQLYPEDINSWTNAGEVMLELSTNLMKNGKKKESVAIFEEAINALRKAIELDKTGQHASALRARALVGVTAAAAGATKKAS